MAGNKCLCTGGMMNSILNVNSHPLTYRISCKQTHLHYTKKTFLFFVSNQTKHSTNKSTEAKYTFTLSIFIQAPYKQTTFQGVKVLNT